MKQTCCTRAPDAGLAATAAIDLRSCPGRNAGRRTLPGRSRIAAVEWTPPARERGQGLIEYGLILMVMAVICTVSLLFFADQLSSLLSLIASAV